ncbi:hypothetical protein ETR14_27835 (plasmid) [Sphingosinicella sp. BN140058]|nr:hypothetical protein ETR14_27835 [Sphingosinicella sp. BN140058]
MISLDLAAPKNVTGTEPQVGSSDAGKAVTPFRHSTYDVHGATVVLRFNEANEVSAMRIERPRESTSTVCVDITMVRPFDTAFVSDLVRCIGRTTLKDYEVILGHLALGNAGAECIARARPDHLRCRSDGRGELPPFDVAFIFESMNGLSQFRALEMMADDETAMRHTSTEGEYPPIKFFKYMADAPLDAVEVYSTSTRPVSSAGP